MRVLVTGASGMLGRATALAVASRGHDVTVAQRGRSAADLQHRHLDLTDAVSVELAVRDQDAVVHLGARVGASGSWGAFAEVNVEGTRRLLAAARRSGVQAFVHVSSPSVAHAGSAVVGDGAAAPADPATARGHYARSKALAEQLALAADDADVAVTAIRPRLVWGPGDQALVPRIVERAAAGRLVTIGTGAALIDTTFVDNAADAIAQALDRIGRVRGRALVITNGEPRPVSEIIARICRACGVSPPSRHVPASAAVAGAGLVERAWALSRRRDEPPLTRSAAEQLAVAAWWDQREVRRLLAWQPTVSLDEGFERLAAAGA